MDRKTTIKTLREIIRNLKDEALFSDQDFFEFPSELEPVQPDDCIVMPQSLEEDLEPYFGSRVKEYIYKKLQL